MGSASKVFDKMLERDLVSWTCVINGFVDNTRPLEGLRLFKKMEMEPNDVTMISVLRACAETIALSAGMNYDPKLPVVLLEIDDEEKASQ
ncbi:hypothetical protein L1987_60946 [Smallanthus sonchifolius]|uniref:Uncharacterized protein n=1 Tax=Smallanthus sonchifolius TaxID=185202 RepID=A0ACB9D9T8_9ASTR|nr:hypothetical protein L1987_60946 [Smallanthus sonchifolius]